MKTQCQRRWTNQLMPAVAARRGSTADSPVRLVEIGGAGRGGATDNNPACGWVRALATYPSDTGPHLLVCGYDKAVNLFTVRGDAAFRGF
jgi:hypothetical protein